MEDDDDNILPRPKLEPWQEEIYQYLKDMKAEVDLVTGITFTSMGVDLGREGGDETATVIIDFHATEKRIMANVLKDAVIYGRGYSKTELQNEVLRQQYSPYASIHPPSMLLDEWDDVPKTTYEYIGYVGNPNSDLPDWKQGIPDPQAPKPVSSPSKSKREKLRAKRKKRK